MINYARTVENIDRIKNMEVESAQILVLADIAYSLASIADSLLRKSDG